MNVPPGAPPPQKKKMTKKDKALAVTGVLIICVAIAAVTYGQLHPDEQIPVGGECYKNLDCKDHACMKGRDGVGHCTKPCSPGASDERYRCPKGTTCQKVTVDFKTGADGVNGLDYCMPNK
jgi:hypothetical protein